jgi:hypothetical protein
MLELFIKHSDNRQYLLTQVIKWKWETNIIIYLNVPNLPKKDKLGVKSIIHQSELRTYTKVVPYKEKSSFRFVLL